MTFNLGHQIIRELLGAGHSFFGRWPMQSLLNPSFSEADLNYTHSILVMLAVSAMAD